MPLDIKHYPLKKGDPPRGTPALFLGRDTYTYGTEGTGWVKYAEDFECGGIEGKDAADYQCPHLLDEGESLGRVDPQIDVQIIKNGDAEKKERLLHVQVASHRDPLCPVTLHNLFTKAAYPDLLRVRVLQQNDPEVDEDCLKGYCRLIKEKGKKNESFNNRFRSHEECPHSDQIFINEIHAKEAKGPTFARGMLSADMERDYYNDKLSPQDFCLSTDSHMDFYEHFDQSMMEMWNRTGNEYAVLSSYVNDITWMDRKGSVEVPHLCMITFTSNVRTHATKLCRSLPRPKLTNVVWGAGLSYSKCHADLKVQVDPHTPFIFDGEEFNRAARFFTYGYDVYTPDASYIFHNYHGSQSNPVMHTWHQNTDYDAERESNKRLATMIGLAGGYTDKEKVMKMRRSKFGLGDRRSLDELTEFSGFDLKNKKVTKDGKNRCGNIRWVRYEQHPKGVNYIPQFNSEEDPLDKPDKTSIWYDLPTPTAIHDVSHTEKTKSTSIVLPAPLKKKMSNPARNLNLRGKIRLYDEHGFKHLPLSIQLSTYFLGCCLVIALIVSSIFRKKSGLKARSM